MKRITEISQVHAILLKIASEFHRICKLNNIPYYMLGGTMLGTIRHQGFIPWDDDMDFGIPREYFGLFCKVAEKSLSKDFKLCTYENSSYASLGIVKISYNQSIIKEIYKPNSDEEIGINIDIFPLDSTNQYFFPFSYNWNIRCLFKLQKLLVIEPRDRGFPKRCLAYLIRTILPKKIPIIKFLTRILESRPQKDSYKMYINYFGGWGKKELVEKRIFGYPKLYKFEDMSFMGVEHANEYLTAVYGDYMQLPPENKRHTHLDEIYVK